MSNIIQFNYRRHWKHKVWPYLTMPLVRWSVEIGMKLYDPTWSWDDGPHAIGKGALNGQRVRKDKLSWYQPWGRCHYISFFSCALGVINYPELDWQFLSGPCHTVPVGSANGEPRVVMDILLFKEQTAEESIAFAQYVPPGREPDDSPQWAALFAAYAGKLVPVLRNWVRGC
jgi:hypothetical protein